MGTNASGFNAFFLRNDLVDHVLPKLEAIVAYPTSIRNDRDKKGSLVFTAPEHQAKIIAALPWVNVETGATVTLAELGELYSPAMKKLFSRDI